MMPDGWDTRTLGEFATLQRGFDLPLRKRRRGPIPIFASNGMVDWHDEPRVAGPGVVTGRSGTVGKAFLVESDFWPLNTTLYVKDFHGNAPEYVFRFLEYFRLGRFSTGTGVPTLNRNVVHREHVAVPPLPEQKKIAAILGSVDAAISATQAVIDQTHKVKQGLLQQLLTRGIGHTRFKKTEIGEIPEEWEVHELGDFIPKDAIRNGLYKPLTEYGDGTPIIRIDGFDDGDRLSTAPPKRVRTTPEEESAFGVERDDLLINRVNSLSHLGKSAIVASREEPTVFESNMMCVRVCRSVGLLPEYLLYLLSSRPAKDQILS